MRKACSKVRGVEVQRAGGPRTEAWKSLTWHRTIEFAGVERMRQGSLSVMNKRKVTFRRVSLTALYGCIFYGNRVCTPAHSRS